MGSGFSLCSACTAHGLTIQCNVNLNLICVFHSQRLNQVLDFENGGVSKHLGQIADSMYEWEEQVAEQLGLTPADVAAIKVKHPSELRLQT